MTIFLVGAGFVEKCSVLRCSAQINFHYNLKVSGEFWAGLGGPVLFSESQKDNPALSELILFTKIYTSTHLRCINTLSSIQQIPYKCHGKVMLDDYLIRVQGMQTCNCCTRQVIDRLHAHTTHMLTRLWLNYRKRHF